MMSLKSLGELMFGYFWQGVVLCSVAIAVPAADVSPATAAAAVGEFNYDSNQALDIQDKVVKGSPEFVIHDISYASANGQRVAAYLIAPKTKGPHPAILFAHWGNGTRGEFLPEAELYAKAGVVSLLPDYPWDRPEPYHKSLGNWDKPELDREALIQAVVDLRRGADLLLKRDDVDSARFAYVGHSFGAQFGAILSAVDHRPKAFVLMAGVAESADIYLKSPSPDLVGLRKRLPAGRLEAWVHTLSDLDALHFVGRGSAPVLLQFGRFEQYFDEESMRHYIAAAKEPKRVMWYDCAHDLNDPQALRDRTGWLATTAVLPTVPF